MDGVRIRTNYVWSLFMLSFNGLVRGLVQNIPSTIFLRLIEMVQPPVFQMLKGNELNKNDTVINFLANLIIIN